MGHAAAGGRGRVGLARALLLALVLAAGRALPARAQEAAPIRVLVRVLTAGERMPLGYSVVEVPALGIERLTGAGGTTSLAFAAAGPQRFRVKRLGYLPKDTTVTLTDAPSQVLEVVLARASFRLDAVRVVGWPPCRRPGLREADAQVRGVVEQLRQNAERYRLLTRAYPFFYTMEREFGARATDGSYIADSRSVTAVSGAPDWTYRPGTLIARTGGAGMPAEWVMRIPSIRDLAEDAFIDNHCFHVAGLEEHEGARLLRVDIIAAERLRGVDVNVVAWLDPRDFQLRHATFTLTKPPPQVRGLLYSTTKATYREVLPFVPVLQELLAENTVQQGRARTETRVLIERQRIQALRYTGARPDSLLADTLRRDSLPPPARPR